MLDKTCFKSTLFVVVSVSFSWKWRPFELLVTAFSDLSRDQRCSGAACWGSPSPALTLSPTTTHLEASQQGHFVPKSSSDSHSIIKNSTCPNGNSSILLAPKKSLEKSMTWCKNLKEYEKPKTFFSFSGVVSLLSCLQHRPLPTRPYDCCKLHVTVSRGSSVPRGMEVHPSQAKAWDWNSAPLPWPEKSVLNPSTFIIQETQRLNLILNGFQRSTDFPWFCSANKWFRKEQQLGQCWGSSLRLSLNISSFSSLTFAIERLLLCNWTFCPLENSDARGFHFLFSCDTARQCCAGGRGRKHCWLGSDTWVRLFPWEQMDKCSLLFCPVKWFTHENIHFQVPQRVICSFP